jgi:hypothetical protein
VDIYNGTDLVYSNILTGLANSNYFDDLPGGITGDRVRLTTLNAKSFHLAEVMVFVPEPSRALFLGLSLCLFLPRRKR